MSAHESPYNANGEDDKSSQQKQNSHGWTRERPGTRERGRERERDRDRHFRDHKARGLRDHGGRGKYDNYSSRKRDYFRKCEYSRDKEKQHRHRSRSRSRDRFGNRSISPSHSPRSKRRSGFDMAPPVGAILPGAAVPEAV